VAPRTTPARPVAAGVAFGGNEMYVAGGGLPEGDYALIFGVQMYQATNKAGIAQGAARLGIMLTAYSLTEPGAEPKTKFLSMGSSADKSFAPDPASADENGVCKRLIVVPGAQGQTLPDSTNWNLFRKSLYDCGLPDGVFVDDVSVLDGIHVHVTNVPEPEERKGFGNKAATGEVQQEERRQNQTIPVVTEIKDDGKPWEGTGGIPEATAAPVAPAKVGPKGVVKTAARTVVVAAPAAVADDADLEAVATSAATAILVDPKNANGMAYLPFRIAMLKEIEKTSTELSQQAQNTYFANDAALSQFLGLLGYAKVGSKVQPA
jgi:hypothetical protein